MKITSHPVLVLHENQALRAAIESLSDRGYSYHPVSDWVELTAALYDGPPSALAVVDPFKGSEDGSNVALRRLVDAFPALPVLAAVRVAPGSGDELVALAEARIVDVIAIGHDDTPDGLHERLRLARSRPLKVLLESLLPADSSGWTRAIVEAAAGAAAVGGDSRDMCDELHMSGRTLLRWCRRSGLPDPRRLLAWTRVLMAAQLLDDPGRTVTSVTTACGYTSDMSLRRTLQTFLNETPVTLRRRGGAVNVAADAFVASLRRSREERTKRG